MTLTRTPTLTHDTRDWQGPGYVNALSSISSFVENMPGVPQHLRVSLKPNKEFVLFAGHSMGGHGCWVLSGHNPDITLGAICASPWLTFDLYSPFTTRIGYSLASTFEEHLMNAAAAEYDVELYASNMVGVPVLTKQGKNDQTVPPYHARRMQRLIDSHSGNLSAVISRENQWAHWFGGILNDADSMAFAQNITKWTARPRSIPAHFRVVTMNPASSGSVGSIRILQVALLSRKATADVTIHSDGTWTIATSNVLRFGFEKHPLVQYPTGKIVIDKHEFLTAQFYPGSHYWLRSQVWQTCSGCDWELKERGPRTYGPLARVLEGSVKVIFGTSGSNSNSAAAASLGVAFANDLFFLGYNIPVLADRAAATMSLPALGSANLVLIGGPDTNAVTAQCARRWAVPLTFHNRSFTVGIDTFDGPGVGIAALAPNCFSASPDQLHTVVVVAGTDAEGTARALAQLPRRSGMGAPDYVVVGGPRYGWGGVGGWLASGYWGNTWGYSPSAATGPSVGVMGGGPGQDPYKKHRKQHITAAVVGVGIIIVGVAVASAVLGAGATYFVLLHRAQRYYSDLKEIELKQRHGGKT
eukprot:TRINITY_DN1023_c0_g1_i1.p1 TRINITY_DN1023_c0_g1~~TRINITY_DN1023_c0_g1_i1.p1  ORF type:complete len:584 (-),score=99.03 TRINITY_DN1023_c0_g1_i1:64-1815(-)